MASEVRWIKIVTDIFDDEKILLIESMPESDGIIVIWFKLLCLAGKQNNNGVFMLNDRVPYTEEMLSHIFRRPLNTVRMALKVFEQYGMIEIVNDTIMIPNWAKHQQLDKLEKRREYQRNLMAERRASQKKIAMAISDENGTDQRVSANSNANACVTSANALAPVSVLDKDKDIDIKNTSYSSPDLREDPGRTKTETGKTETGKTETGKRKRGTAETEETEPAKYRIILNDRSYFGITRSMIDHYRELYPAIDVEQSIRNMIGWCESNPKNRKTRDGVKRFVTNWLTRDQNKAPRQNAPSVQNPVRQDDRGLEDWGAWTTKGDGSE